MRQLDGRTGLLHAMYTYDRSTQRRRGIRRVDHPHVAHAFAVRLKGEPASRGITLILCACSLVPQAFSLHEPRLRCSQDACDTRRSRTRPRRTFFTLLTAGSARSS